MIYLVSSTSNSLGNVASSSVLAADIIFLMLIWNFAKRANLLGSVKTFPWIRCKNAKNTLMIKGNLNIISKKVFASMFYDT